ncbi:MAG: hypothetical protein MJZ61_04890 [Bacteroidales bacterium]|nr:hypothetical protein [Bacteroidales bacterium]
MTNRICPYPGLRPFTEEESIFFKGRDLHIRQIVKLLEENKMAFITGASGDGKSSMVYAGVIPYIRAGFFKSSFNGWSIVDFKPQKNPLQSLTDALSEQLEIDNSKCLHELEKGFSSLVDLYKESPLYATDGDDAANRGKNLLIIADQFEEVFTNFENFDQGKPSDECYTTVNLLLETIRISISEKLPVYVIFTMRSDFISQCTIFKDLPEYIAYSQFFVPQLKRTEIRQVIEEPALLAGGKISSRLTEVIINNLNSGFDQLPVLQHALNLLWRMADNGDTEMDLIHLAKIAGISSEVLGPEDRGEFDRWYKNLPDYHHKYYEKPDLNNVLNAHAGILYESAYDYFMQNSDWAEKSITPDESKEIIEIVFKSLTKIDNNRPVRNRCTLSEITGIINKENITNATVCGVINIFRTPENSLIKPFSVPGRTDTMYLSGDTVLDVTHEALIRNWKLLTEWDLEEESDMKDYHDFNTQMQLWAANDKNSAYLLNSGTYTYFNQWFNRSKPNPSLFVKYDNSKLPQRQKIRNAQYKYENYVDFLESSYKAILAKEQAVKRRVQLVIWGLLVFIATLGGFVWWAMEEKANAEHQKNIAESQSQYALEQQELAEQQEKLAVRANWEAQQQRDTAQMMAARAIKAMNESEKARRLAEYMHRQALTAQEEAEKNFLLAEEQRKIAEGDREKLQDQMKLTAEAQAKSERFNFLAMSNLLAMKTKSQYEDPKMNLRFALTAYNMMVSNDIDNVPELYDAILYAMEQNGMLEPMKTSNNKLLSFSIDDEGKVVCISDNAHVFVYSLQGGKTKELSKLTKYETKLPLQNAIFLDPYNVVYSTSDHNTYHLNIKTQERSKLSSQGEVVKSAGMTPDGKYIVTGYSGGRITVLNASDPEDHIVASVNFKTRLVDLCCSPNCTDVYALTQRGELIKWSIKDNKQKVIFQQKDQKASAIVSIPDKRQLAICFDKGNIEFVDVMTDTKVDAMLGGHSGLESAVYDSQQNLLALSGSDHRVTIINTQNLSEKPTVIEEHLLNRSSILAHGIGPGRTTFVLTDDNALRYFSLDISMYIDQIKSRMIMPLNEDELQLILGRDFLKRD